MSAAEAESAHRVTRAFAVADGDQIALILHGPQIDVRLDAADAAVFAVELELVARGRGPRTIESNIGDQDVQLDVPTARRLAFDIVTAVGEVRDDKLRRARRIRAAREA